MPSGSARSRSTPASAGPRSSTATVATSRGSRSQPRGWVCGDYVKAIDEAAVWPGGPAPRSRRDRARHLRQGHRAELGDLHAREAREEARQEEEAGEEGPGPIAEGRRRRTRRRRGVPKMIEDAPIVGSLNVRQYDELTVGGKTYWKIAQKDNLYVLAVRDLAAPALALQRRRGSATTPASRCRFAFAWPRGGIAAGVGDREAERRRRGAPDRPAHARADPRGRDRSKRQTQRVSDRRRRVDVGARRPRVPGRRTAAAARQARALDRRRSRHPDPRRVRGRRCRSTRRW